MKNASRNLAVATYVAGVLLIHSLVAWNARDLIWKGYPDFTIYYTAGTMVRQGMGHSLYDDRLQLKIQKEFAPQVATRLGALPFNHPPFEALLFLPLTCLPYPGAFLLWELANLAMLVCLPHLIRPYVPVLALWPVALWTLAGLAFFPIFFALLQGQDAILLLFLFAASFVSLRKERFMSAGAWLACALFKFHLVLPFLLLLLIQEKTLQSRKRIVLGFSMVATLLGLLSIAVVGIRQVISYPRYVLGLERTMAMGAIMPSDMPNLRGVLYLIASKASYLNLLVLFRSGVLFLRAAWSSRSLSFAPPDIATDDLKFSMAVFATVLVSYHALGYDLCILALPLLLIAGQSQRIIRSGSWTRAAILAGTAALLFSPLLLVLLMRFNRLALLGWGVLACFLGLAGELRLRNQQLTA